MVDRFPSAFHLYPRSAPSRRRRGSAASPGRRSELGTSAASVSYHVRQLEAQIGRDICSAATRTASN
jgi:hypothetical protein